MDQEWGYILSTDYKRQEKQVELMTLIIGAVSSHNRQFADLREIFELAAEDRHRRQRLPPFDDSDIGQTFSTSW